MQWRNWDGRVRSRPVQWLRPAGEAELCEQVGRLAAAGHKLRVCGSGHSFTPLAASADVLISLERLSGVTAVDRARGEVEVFAGTSLRRLGRELAELGLAQENLGDIDAQTLAGATATGTHGTGAAFACLSSQISGFTLVTAEGRQLRCDAENEPELFAAGRVSLGTLGVLSRIRLRVQPNYRLHLRMQRGTLEHCLEHAQRYADAFRNFEFYWFPGTPHTLMKFTQTTTAPARPRSAWQRAVAEVMETGVFGGLSRLCRAAPVLSPALAELAGRCVGTGELIDEAHRVYPTSRRVRFHECEYALPRDALATALGEIRERIAARRYPVFFPLECRFAAADDIWLSPGYGRDSCFIALHMYRGMPFENYFRELEAILRAHGGRPHWGKWHSLEAAELQPLYPHWDDFQRLRRRLDPGGSFLNPYLERLLG